jgi:hypothetical protein
VRALLRPPPGRRRAREEITWQATERGWLYILGDADHGGNSIVAMAVPDIEAVFAL